MMSQEDILLHKSASVDEPGELNTRTNPTGYLAPAHRLRVTISETQTGPSRSFHSQSG